MKIYTKTGDSGQTSLLGGSRVDKFHLRIEAYGSLDELNSWIGLIADEHMHAEVQKNLHKIQNLLFVAGSHLAAENEQAKSYLPAWPDQATEDLEKLIDEMTTHLKPLKNFILPGGHFVASYCHIARCVCRRAERIVVLLSTEEQVNPSIIKYLNRLSDYLFTLSRFTLFLTGIDEIYWKSK
ncbi:MAG: cob(I)yrinic acid a,c-diamide adenosyltransferase [Thermaurantimonas sp.]